MGIVGVENFVIEDTGSVDTGFIIRTSKNTTVSDPNEDFANTLEDINELADGPGLEFADGEEIGGTISIPNLAPIDLASGWNTIGYTLTYDFHFPSMLLALLKPEYFSTERDIIAFFPNYDAAAGTGNPDNMLAPNFNLGAQHHVNHIIGDKHSSLITFSSNYINTSSLEFGLNSNKGLFYVGNTSNNSDTFYFSSSNFSPIPIENISGSLFPIDLDVIVGIGGSASGDNLTTAFETAVNNTEDYSAIKKERTSGVGPFNQISITSKTRGITPQTTSTFSNTSVNSNGTSTFFDNFIDTNQICSIVIEAIGTPTHSIASINGKTINDLVVDAGVRIAKNNAAQVYWPEYKFNGIGDFLVGQGYQIKMDQSYSNLDFGLRMLGAVNEGITDFNSFVEATKESKITLSQGWNIISYNRKGDPSNPLNVAEFFRNFLGVSSDDDVAPFMTVIKNNAGQIYWPEFGFNGIGDFIPGQGYPIRTITSIPDFQFPFDQEISDTIPLTDQPTEPDIL